MSALEKVLSELVGDAVSTEQEMTSEEATRLLNLGPNPYNLSKGMDVVLSPEGEKSVRYPKKDTNQKARIIAVFSEYRIDNEGRPYNGLVDVAINTGIIITFPADLRHYQPVQQA
jgi:hypothetical protein